MFKEDWEKTEKPHNIATKEISNMFSLSFPSKKIKDYKIISGGCANLNILINKDDPLILRIYLRNKDACNIEKNVNLLLGENIPVPKTFFVGEYNDYQFAVTEFMPGRTLRNLLLAAIEYDIGSIMYDLGMIVGNISSHKFEHLGLFDNDLNVVDVSTKQGYLEFVASCLNSTAVASDFEPGVISKIDNYFKDLLPVCFDETEPSLVHGDSTPQTY